MPRQGRIWTPGDILSVVVRAHEGQPLFATEEDREFLVCRLARVFALAEVDLLAWAALINHFHLLVRVTWTPPETLFRRLNTAIGMRARRLRGDHGATLQDRYWSRPCTTEEGVIAALTYVLGNPVHHGAVPSAEALESYRWSGYGEALGVRPPRLLVPARTLKLLHEDPDVAREALRRAMRARVAGWTAARDGYGDCEEPGCRGAADACLLAHPRRERRPAADAPPGPPPLRWRPESICAVHDEREDRRARLRAAGWRPSDLVLPVCERLGADPADLASGRRAPAASTARALISHVACDGVGVPCETVAPLLGVTSQAVSFARRRGREALSEKGWSIDDVLSWRGAGS